MYLSYNLKFLGKEGGMKISPPFLLGFSNFLTVQSSNRFHATMPGHN